MSVPLHMAILSRDSGLRADRKPVFIQNDWDGLISGLGRDPYDMVSGIEITPGKVLFSSPYYVAFAISSSRISSPWRASRQARELPPKSGHLPAIRGESTRKFPVLAGNLLA